MTLESVPSKDSARNRYEEMKRGAASLDLTRGKPSPEQLTLSNDLHLAIGPSEFKAADGTDTRNYGGIEGLTEARKLFGAILGVDGENVLAGGNSSLAMMYEVLVHAMLQGVPHGKPWRDQAPRFLCPSPGYDRHFAICEHLGIEMIPVAMRSDGPDMDELMRHARDERVKGMWIVPKYGNPTGVTLSDAVVRGLATMKTAASDFRIMWDDAYAVHHLETPGDQLADIYTAARQAGYDDRVIAFTSFSKVTFAGAGVAAMAASGTNIAWMKRHHGFTSIGPDKVNQLRHVRFLKDADGVRALMTRHAAILKPKFDVVQKVLEEELGGSGLATWTKPRGGYFVSFDTQPGKATKVAQLAADAGVKLTPPGSAFPYRKDPSDTHIRIAPSFPSLPDLERAMRVLAVSVRVASGG